MSTPRGFIRITYAYSGKPGFVNAAHVSTFNEDLNRTYGGNSELSVLGTGDACTFCIAETVDEIAAMMCAALAPQHTALAEPRG